MNLKPTLTKAGTWTPVDRSNAGYSNNLGFVPPASRLVKLADGSYGLVFTSWGYFGWGADSNTPSNPLKMSIFALTQDEIGLFKTNATLLPGPVNDGSHSIITADFNGDGVDDIVLMGHNESPFVATPSVAYMSKTSGGFEKVILPGKVMAHDAQVVFINGVPTIITATFTPGDINPTYQYLQGKWVESISENRFTGMSVVIGDFGKSNQYEMIVGDVVKNYNPETNMFDWRIESYKYDPLNPDKPLEIVQTITPYLSTLPQYKDFVSFAPPPGATHTYRIWSDDLNHDGYMDVLAGESMWSQLNVNYPTALQLLINSGDGTFKDFTATLNPDMPLSTDELSYNPTFLDVDRSGINSYMFGGGSFVGAGRQSNYLLLNDGTGRLYVALHDQFAIANEDIRILMSKEPPGYGIGDFIKFIAVPNKDGSIDYVAEVPTAILDGSSWITSYTYINVPIHYNQTTDFTTDVSIASRNGSKLMRTWAGNDTVYDKSAGLDAKIDGGLGYNTAVYSGTMSQYQIKNNSDGTITVSSLAGQNVPVVSDTLKNFQTLKFLDQKIDYFAIGINATGSAADDQMLGTGGNDTLNGGAGNDTLLGGAGNDTLIGGADNDRLEGGDGLDVASYADLTTTLYVDFTQFSGTLTTALGTDTLISIEGIIGGSGDDVLKGDAGANYFESGAGQDFLDGRGGDDTLIAGAGNDGLTGGDGNDTLDGGEGDDAVLGDAGDDLLYGGAGRDYVVGGDGADRIYGGDGNDVIGGWIGNDVIYGDLGADWIYGDAGDDAIDGGDGGDGIFGGEGNDTLLGGLGDDQIIGGSGNDTMQGQDGNDILSGNEGDDNLTGAAGNDSLYGDTGNDTIDGGEGNDTLIGGYGTDSLYGGAGNDYMTGGEDNDILQGQAGDDGILGDGGNDTIDGGDGNDTLLGGDGNDTITGGLGNDYFEGGTGNDSLNGGEGNDTLVGGAGQDTLTGGAGADGFFFTALSDSTSAAPDKITDFSWADGDYINLSQIDANSALAGDQAFSFVNSFTKQAGQATLTYDAASNTSTFSADVDGDGVADFVLQVTGQQDTGHGWVL